LLHRVGHDPQAPAGGLIRSREYKRHLVRPFEQAAQHPPGEFGRTRES
jgi:hypothetical protein